MNLPFIHGRRDALGATVVLPQSAHDIESGFSYQICRFVLDCSCGAHHDTPFIDEALEWRELHAQLAPLADQLA
jgi:hypothetical protein